MKAPAVRTPAAQATLSSRAARLAPIQAEADERWRRSFCGPSCPCPRCSYTRALARVEVAPSTETFDANDPAFRAEYARALETVQSIEDERRRRIAYAIAAERLQRLLR